jgi:hypothetical protein
MLRASQGRDSLVGLLLDFRARIWKRPSAILRVGTLMLGLLRIGLVSVAVVGWTLAATQATAGPLTQFELLSEPGDFVGLGQTYLRDLTTGTFDIVQVLDLQGDGLADELFLRYLGNQPGTFAHIWFATNQLPGVNLTRGFYPDAERAPFAGPGHPGLSWELDGRGCNTLSGNFTILGAQFDYSGATPQLLSFGATFVQHCEGAAPALLGTFYYNFDPANAVPEPSTLSLLALGCCGVLTRARMKRSPEATR